jgi:WbqC-like protein family
MPDTAVAVHQPNFLPWLKLLDKILASDIYVAYDTAQYTKSEFHGRQRVRTYTGEFWLTVPLLTVPRTRQLIGDVRIDNNQPFRHRHLKMLRKAYGRADYFGEVFPIVEQAYARDHERLVDLNLDLISAFCSYLGSDVKIVRASRLWHTGDNTDRLIALVRGVGGNAHLTSTFGTARQYVDWDRVQTAGITVRSQVFNHPVYNQPWRGFIPYLAALDMLFSCGRATANILEAGRRFETIDSPAGRTWIPPAAHGATPTAAP